MMAHSPMNDIEDLTLCSFCKLPFNDTDQAPKVLACKHHFCLKCVNTVLLKGRELYCLYCWKRTELPALRTDALPTYGAVLALARRLGSLGSLGHLPAPPRPPDKAENCHTHAMPYTLWCHSCALPICRACASHPEHAAHRVKPQADARHLLRADARDTLHAMQKMLADVQGLVHRQRDFLVKILEACTTLKTQVETDLVNNAPGFELSEARDRLHKARQSYSAAESQSPAEVHRLLGVLVAEKERLQAKHHEMFLQCKLDDLIRNSSVIFDFDLLKQALATIHSGETSVQSDNGHRNPVLFLANYCMSQLYSRHFLFKQRQQQVGPSFPGAPNGDSDYPAPLARLSYVPLVMPDSDKNGDLNTMDDNLLKAGIDGYSNEHPSGALPNLNVSKASPLSFGDNGGSLHSPNLKNGAVFQSESMSMGLPSLLPVHPGGPGMLPPSGLSHSPQAALMRNPSAHIYPIYYFNIEINGAPFGRILIEVRSDAAPKMAKNFGILSTGELGIGYKGCGIFQCWENESIITGDFELNNGRGGRSVFEESFFMPDDTKILAIRGSVGMRRSQKRHDNLGLVGSQFRIILREMRGFTGIFAFVVEGLELVDRISQSGDSAGKPQSNILIAGCGKLN